MSNPNDVVRDKLLRTMYEFHRDSKSPRSAAKGIMDIQRAMKSLNVKQRDVSHNLDYLLQKGWVTEVTLDRTFKTKNGTIQNAEQVKYKISDVGIDHLEAASLFKKANGIAAINITNVKGVTVVGDGNVVNTNLTDAMRQLNELKGLLADSPSLDDQMRLSATSDIETIQAQLQKPSPSSSVLATVWGGIAKAADLAGALDLSLKIYRSLQPYLAGA